jgi:hypothetical protein
MAKWKPVGVQQEVSVLCKCVGGEGGVAVRENNEPCPPRLDAHQRVIVCNALALTDVGQETADDGGACEQYGMLPQCRVINVSIFSVFHIKQVGVLLLVVPG